MWSWARRGEGWLVAQDDEQTPSGYKVLEHVFIQQARLGYLSHLF